MAKKGNMETKPGLIIPFSLADKILVKHHERQADGYGCLLETISAKMHFDRKVFWESLREIHPDLDGFDFTLDYDREVMVIQRAKKPIFP